MIEWLYAVALTAAVIAVLVDLRRSGRFVVAIAMIAAFYQLVQIMGPLWSLMIVVFEAAAVKIVAEALGADMFDDATLAVTLDQVLTRLQGGGGQGDDTGGGGRPRIWGDQDDDD